MAKVPIEIALVGEKSLAGLRPAIALANSVQNEFLFSSAPEDLARRIQMHVFEHNRVSDLFDRIESVRADIRGYYPFIIVAIDSELQGERFANLFGSHRAEKGLAVITTSLVPDIIVPSDRMVCYFIYYLARYALSFISPSHRNHDDARGCVLTAK